MQTGPRTFFLILFLLFTAACGGGSSDPAGSDSQAGQDSVTSDAGEQPSCRSISDCEGRLQPGQCRRVACDDGTCVAVPVAAGMACDDGNPCTTLDSCNLGRCEGSPVACDDQNPCTSDQCDPATGACSYLAREGSCNDQNPCTTTDRCEAGVCVGRDNVCGCEADGDCEEFDDANLCNGVMRCLQGECRPDPLSVVTCDQPTGPCRTIICDPSDGLCREQHKPNGTPCDDGDLCTTADKCQGGLCVGGEVNPDDGNPCTRDECDPQSGVSNDPVQDGQSCSDGDLCTYDDQCVSGWCRGTESPDCACEDDLDCAPFDDGNLCNGELACLDHRCGIIPGSVVECPAPASACTWSVCSPQSGACSEQPVLDGTPCDDQDACTWGDYCSLETCLGFQEDPDDWNPCTDDGCDPQSGVYHEPLTGPACDDGDPCTGGDQCQGGVCLGQHLPECGCVQDSDCDALEDGDLCNGSLVCVNSSCVVDPVTVVECGSLSQPCREMYCVPETGACQQIPSGEGEPCDDGSLCTTGDHCDEGWCTGTLKVCDDHNLCTDDSCDPAMGCVHWYNFSACDDGNSCTLYDMCTSGVCTGEANPECQCEDKQDCASHEDGNLCNGTLVCVANKCVLDQATVVTCEPAPGPCRLRNCVPETGLCQLTNVNDGWTCQDGDLCTVGDHCLGGTCIGGAPAVCQDDNPCTQDACEPDLGCIHPFSSGSCDDHDPCTGGDFCSQGICQPGPADNCDSPCQAAATISCGQSSTWGTDLAGATDEVIQYSCGEGYYQGPEYAYTFTTGIPAQVTARLVNEEAATELMVLQGQGQGCDPDTCLARGFSQVTFDAAEDQNYYLVVDGRDEGPLAAAGGYRLEVSCIYQVELDCDNQLDDDQDSLFDCDDPDCREDEACLPPACLASGNLSCGSSGHFTNYSDNLTDLDSYSCTGLNMSGPEVAFRFVPETSGEATVTMSNPSSNKLGILIVPETGGVCDPGECLEYGQQQVTFPVVAARAYYIIVDAKEYGLGSFDLAVSCISPEECANNEDEDGDGLVDCEDPDCAFAAGCMVTCGPTEPGDQQDLETADLTSISNYPSDSAPPHVTDRTDYYSCAEGRFDGSEMTFTLVPASDGAVDLELAYELGDTTIFLIAADQDGECQPGNCLASGSQVVSAPVQAGKRYYVVVDSPAGGEGSFDLNYQLWLDHEDCATQLDDDQDGYFNCQDLDCVGDSSCTYCNPSQAFQCSFIWSSTDGYGATDKVDSYGCWGADDFTGPEKAFSYYHYQGTSISMITVELEASDPDLRLLVLQKTGETACNPATCLSQPYDNKYSNMSLIPGTTYYFVVDGKNNASGDFTLKGTCY